MNATSVWIHAGLGSLPSDVMPAFLPAI